MIIQKLCNFAPANLIIMNLQSRIAKIMNNKKGLGALVAVLLIVIMVQSVFIGKLYTAQNQKSYEVNLVQINTKKDSVDYLEMKNNLLVVDQTVRELNAFLAEKNLSDARIETLSQDSISNTVYLSKQSNRYSQYLVDLQTKLQQVPLGIPAEGYISSNFGKRVNPIPPRNVMFASANAVKPAPVEPTVIEEKDSLGNVIRKSVPAAKNVAAAKTPATETKAPIQFHKGMDFATPYGTEVRAAAKGTVIFAGQKGGYGNCVIVSHGNGLATLYGHLSAISVKANQQVNVNQVIAKSGNSGRSTGPHLHYEVHKNNTPVNPKLFLNI